MPTEKTKLRMNAYYYSFDSTGVELVDRVLSAIACAGKGYHHTEGWNEPIDYEYPPFRGASYTEFIQNAANDAATAVRERDSLRAALVGVVGAGTRAELEQMEAVLRLAPAPAADKAVLIDAIHALLATLSEPEAVGAVDPQADASSD